MYCTILLMLSEAGKEASKTTAQKKSNLLSWYMYYMGLVVGKWNYKLWH